MKMDQDLVLRAKVTGKFNLVFSLKTFTTSSNFWSAFCLFSFNHSFLMKASTLLKTRMHTASHLTYDTQVTDTGSEEARSLVVKQRSYNSAF